MSYQEVYRMVKEAGMKKEALTSKGALKNAIKELMSLLRTRNARRSFLQGISKDYPDSAKGYKGVKELPYRIGEALNIKAEQLERSILNSRERKAPSPFLNLLSSRYWYKGEAQKAILDKIPKNIFTGKISQQNADLAADKIWHEIRDAYLPSPLKRKTPLDKWY